MAHWPLIHLTVDVTPPILTFIRKPLRSLSKANITWIISEEASGVCEVVGPSFYRSVVCDKTWSEDYLPEGDFTLNVTVYDESLNMAGPFQHKWHNSKCSIKRTKHFNEPFCSKCSRWLFSFVIVVASFDLNIIYCSKTKGLGTSS